MADFENPKERARQRRKSGNARVVQLTEFENPIPAQINDVEELKEFFEKYPQFVPYSGTSKYSSHSLLLLLNSMATMGTQAACIESIARFSFGGKVSIVRRTDPVFELDEPGEPSPREKMEFYQHLKEYFRFYDVGGSLVSIREFAKAIFHDQKASGNAFVEVVLTEVAGQRRVSAKILHTEHCLYLATEPGEQKYVGVSYRWDDVYIRQNPPRLLPLHPTFEQDEDGVLRTVIHLKQGNYNWYGRPDSMGSFLDQYGEMQHANYLIKMSRGGFMGLVFVELEEDNPEIEYSMEEEAREAGFENLQDRMDENFSMRGKDPTGMMLVTRPYGGRQMVVGRVEPNTNENYFQVTGEMREASIIRSHQWSRRILGDSVPSGFSNNIFADELKTKSDVIENARLDVSELINKIIWDGNIFLEQPQFEELSVAFQSPLFDFEQKGDGDAVTNQQTEEGEDTDNTVGSD